MMGRLTRNLSELGRRAMGRAAAPAEPPKPANDKQPAVIPALQRAGVADGPGGTRFVIYTKTFGADPKPWFTVDKHRYYATMGEAIEATKLECKAPASLLASLTEERF